MNNPLQNKLLQFEVQPPDGMWDQISASLDQSVFPDLAEKLRNYEAAPSPLLWNRIVSRLSTTIERQGKVVPFLTRYQKPLKYSGAVAVFIFLAVVTSLLVSKRTESEVPVAGTTTNTIKKNQTPRPDTNITNTVARNLDAGQPEVAVQKRKKTRILNEPASPDLSLAQRFLPLEVERTETVKAQVGSDKYMIYSDSQGNAIRLPKKIFSAFACPTNSPDCKQKLQMLKEKFAASATTADFSGVLEILKNLQENQ